MYLQAGAVVSQKSPSGDLKGFFVGVVCERKFLGIHQKWTNYFNPEVVALLIHVKAIV